MNFIRFITLDVAGAFEGVGNDVKEQTKAIFESVMPAVTLIIGILFLIFLIKALIKNHREGGASWTAVVTTGIALIIAGGATAYLNLLI